MAVDRGEFVVIMGPSGCGKTTLLRIALGVEKADSGAVHVDPGEKLAFAPQDPHLLPWRSLFENAALGLELGVSLGTGHIDRVNSLIDEYGLGGFEDTYPSELSGGMRQRTNLIRALASGPSILFCDEPFSQVDFVTRIELNQVLKRMCAVQRVSTLFVTHNIEEAIFLGDRIYVLSGRPGQIVSTYEPALSVRSGSAVECRKSPEFGVLFQKIWGDIRKRHAG